MSRQSLVTADLLKRCCRHFGLAAVGDHGSHAAHGKRTTVVAGLDQKFGVGAHEGCCHGNLGAVRERERLASITEVLDDAEEVVPAARVQP